MIKKFLIKQLEILPFWISLLVIIPISYYTFHSDFIILSKLAQKIAGGNLNFYEDLYIGAANYHVPMLPPLLCLVDGLAYYLAERLGLINFDFTLIYHTPFIHLLLLKSRYIIIFILSYFLVNKVALVYTNQDKKLSRRIANLWIASPILIYLPFVQGNNDIYPAIFSLIFLLFVFRNNFLLAMIFLGLTAALKGYALFLIVPVALILAEKNLKKTLLYCLTSGLAYFLPTLFYLKDVVYFTSGNSEKFMMLSTSIPSSLVSYSIFAIGYFLILLFLYYNDENIENIIDNKHKTLLVYCFLVMSLFFVTAFYPQWFLWILPFFIFLIYKNKKLYSIYILICSAYLSLTYIGYPGNLDIYLWRKIFPSGPKGYYFPVGADEIKQLLMFNAGLFISLLIAFIYFLLKDNRKEKTDDKFSVYLSYLPTAILLLAIYAVALLSK